MDDILKVIEELNLDTNISPEDIPSVDLYMDQVIQLFENKYNDTLRNKDEKILTKTMINNYAKGKLFFPISNKKYSKEHIILISLIYQLKGALSISDIKSTLEEINNGVITNSIEDLDEIYKNFLELNEKNLSRLKEDVKNKQNQINHILDSNTQHNIANIKRILTIYSLIDSSNMYRKIAEKLIDEINMDNK